MTQLDADRALISALGGVTKLAETLQTKVQVVSNWNRRGIPSKVKLAHPELFLRELRDRRHQVREDKSPA